MPSFTSSTFSRHTGRWLVITSILELGLAGFFLYLGLTGLEAAKSGMFLTAGILGLTGVILLLFGLRSRVKARESDRLQAVGIPGTATITGVGQTGMYLNEQPQLELELMISVPGRQPYQATHRAFVPLILLSRVGPGANLPVKVDPADPSNFVIDWQGSSAMAVMPATMATPGMVAAPGATWPPGGVAGAGSSWPLQAGLQMPPGGTAAPAVWPQPGPQGSAWPAAPASTPAATPVVASATGVEQQAIDQLRQHLDASGRRAMARIQAAQDTGATLGSDRLFALTLSVDAPGQSPYQVVHAAMVPPTHLGKIRPGGTLPVKFDPNNPRVLLVDWKDA